MGWAAEAFRKAVTKEQWQAAAAQVQAQAGSKTSRVLMAGANAPKAMRNAQGEFIVVQFSSTFTKIPHVIEIVSPMRDADGVFRVSGYHLRPDKSPAEKAAEAAAAVLPPKASFSDDEIRAILRERIDVAKRGVGMVVGLIDEKGTRVISYGKAAMDAGRPVDGNSLFEIGSITKTFTAIVLADMAARGEVSLDDPIGKYLPSSVKTPTVKRQTNHARATCPSYLRVAAIAVQHEAKGQCESVCRLHGRTTVCVSEWLSANRSVW